MNKRLLTDSCGRHIRQMWRHEGIRSVDPIEAAKLAISVMLRILLTLLMIANLVVRCDHGDNLE